MTPLSTTPRLTIDPKFLPAIRDINNAIDSSMSHHATKNQSGIRRVPESDSDSDLRTCFFRDADRILNTTAYIRYIDKTQVFFAPENDHVTKRSLHVQLVSKIARTIGRYLRLNEDLIEAIALGHDIGHAPYGHDGEDILSDLCQKHGIGRFAHSVSSVQFLDSIENTNLTLQVLDGILCHDGEVTDLELKPYGKKSWADHEHEKKGETGQHQKLIPMTMEGCVVRVSDTIGCIGRDLHDAVSVGLVDIDDVPKSCVNVLGIENRDIVNNLTVDIINNSIGRDSISFSEDVWGALVELKGFNYTNIYTCPSIKVGLPEIWGMFTCMFESFLDDLEDENKDSVIWKYHIDQSKNLEYATMHSDAEIVRDFIAGMTNRYFHVVYEGMEERD